jgi:hypothetical protein
MTFRTQQAELLFDITGEELFYPENSMYPYSLDPVSYVIQVRSSNATHMNTPPVWPIFTSFIPDSELDNYTYNRAKELTVDRMYQYADEYDLPPTGLAHYTVLVYHLGLISVALGVHDGLKSLFNQVIPMIYSKEHNCYYPQISIGG